MLQVITPAKPWSYAYSAWNKDDILDRYYLHTVVFNIPK